MTKVPVFISFDCDHDEFLKVFRPFWLGEAESLSLDRGSGGSRPLPLQGSTIGLILMGDERAIRSVPPHPRRHPGSEPRA